MLLTKTVKIKWNKSQKQNYISKGYDYTKIGDEFEVKISDLPFENNTSVEVKCDYCGNIYTISYKNFNKQKNRSKVQKDACKNCTNKKRKESNLLKYGVEYPIQIEEVQKKVKQTNLEKYGCINPFGNKEVQRKIKQTNLNKYGFENAAKSKDVKNKIKQTNLQKYGVDFYTQSNEFKNKSKDTVFEKYGCEYYVQTDEYKQKRINTSLKKYGVEYPIMCKEVQDKIKATNLERYGVEHVLQNEEIHNKQLETLKSLSKDSISSQQRQISEIIKSEFGNCELNYPFQGYMLDCFVIVNGCKIDIEYDGWYWHKDTQDKDEIRNEKCISENIKVLRIKSGMKIPTKQDLINSINELINNDNLFYKEIILPDWGK